MNLQYEDGVEKILCSEKDIKEQVRRVSREIED